MHDLRTIEIPKITDAVKFEYLCRDLWANRAATNELVSFNGRPGQAQNGVDVFGRRIDSQKWFGLQCKVRKQHNPLTRGEVEEELSKAMGFNPSLSEYLLCTTLDRDKELQKVVREINESLSSSRNLTFDVRFWDDIADCLKGECNWNVYYKYYQTFFADNTTLGHAIGKLFNLELGIDRSLDTHYEVLLGKVPNYRDNDHSNANYFRGTYFVANLLHHKIEVFKPTCLPSDIAAAFPNGLDCFRIAKWINSLDDLDKFIYSEGDEAISYLPIEEHREYIESRKEEEEETES